MERDQRSPQLPRQVHTSALLALRRGVLASHVIVLDDYEAIRILLVLPELDVSPLHRNELAASKARLQCHQKQRVILRANLSRRLEKLLSFARRQRDALDLCRLSDSRETTKARSRIHFDDARFDGFIEYPADHTQRVPDRVARELFLDQRVNHRLDVVALDLIEWTVSEARPEVLLEHSLISVGRGSLAFDSGVVLQPLIRVRAEALRFFAAVKEREVTQGELCFELAPYLLCEFSARADALRLALAVVVHEHVPFAAVFSDLYTHQRCVLIEIVSSNRRHFIGRYPFVSIRFERWHRFFPCLNSAIKLVSVPRESSQ